MYQQVRRIEPDLVDINSLEFQSPGTQERYNFLPIEIFETRQKQKKVRTVPIPEGCSIYISKAILLQTDSRELISQAPMLFFWAMRNLL